MQIVVYTYKMRLVIVFMSFIIVGLAFGSFYYVNFKKENSAYTSKDTATQNGPLYVYKKGGEMTFRNKSSAVFLPVNETKIKIESSATVKTGNGSGYVLLPDNSSISLSTSTEIQISYSQEKITITLMSGSTYHRITPRILSEKYEIKTPNSVSTIRGTKVAVIYDTELKKTYVAVTKHSVEVTPTKETGEVSNAPVIIQEGSTAFIQSSTSSKIATEEGSLLTVVDTGEVKELESFLRDNIRTDVGYSLIPLNRNINSSDAVINMLTKEFTASTTSTVQSSIQEANTEVNKQANSPVQEPQTVPIDSSNNTSSISTPINQQENSPSTGQNLSGQQVISVENKNLKEFPLSQEQFSESELTFISAFYSVYEQKYLVIDPVEYCTRMGPSSPTTTLNALLEITNNAGYILPKQQELLSFASELISACKDGSTSVKKQEFMTKFDILYPY